MGRGRGSLQDFAAPLLLLLHTAAVSLTGWSFLRFLLLVTLVVCDNCVDGFEENLVNPSHLFAATLHVACSHLPSHCHALFLSDWGQPLGFEEVDAGTFGSKIRLETNEDKRSVGAEMKDFGVPLQALLAQGLSSIKQTSYLVHDVFKGVGTVDSKANKQKICLRV
jgi:hypothetical protein